MTRFVHVVAVGIALGAACGVPSGAVGQAAPAATGGTFALRSAPRTAPPGPAALVRPFAAGAHPAGASGPPAAAAPDPRFRRLAPSRCQKAVVFGGVVGAGVGVIVGWGADLAATGRRRTFAARHPEFVGGVAGTAVGALVGALAGCVG